MAVQVSDMEMASGNNSGSQRMGGPLKRDRSFIKGEYDWAHLAYSIWPERVINASHKDRSYAIAYDLEEDLWEGIENGIDR